MSMSRDELTDQLELLDTKIPELLTKYRGSTPEFWNAFAGETDFATEGAGSDDYDWVNEQVDALLRKHDVEIPTDESPVDG